MSNETLPEVVRNYPVPDPGIEEHIDRWVDADKAAGDRAARQVTMYFGLVPIFAIAFVVCYFAIPRTTTANFLGMSIFAQHLWLGLTGGLAVLCIGIGAVQWARLIMNDHEVIEERHEARSSDADRKDAVQLVADGVKDTGLSRRRMIGSAMAGALGIAAVPAVVMLADMGPWPGPGMRKATIERTIWSEGVHLVTDITQRRIKAADMIVGELVNGQPENLFDLHGEDFLVEKSKAAIIIVRMDPASIKVPPSRQDWQVDGILCYSKICTHVGCPISLWEQQTHHLLCPCHQSTFDLGNSGVVVFGPAARSLPQLPITTDRDGFLVARSDFTVPTGPSFFERDSRHDYQDGDS